MLLYTRRPRRTSNIRVLGGSGAGGCRGTTRLSTRTLQTGKWHSPLAPGPWRLKGRPRAVTSTTRTSIEQENIPHLLFPLARIVWLTTIGRTGGAPRSSRTIPWTSFTVFTTPSESAAHGRASHEKAARRRGRYVATITGALVHTCARGASRPCLSINSDTNLASGSSEPGLGREHRDIPAARVPAQISREYTAMCFICPFIHFCAGI